jgi:hypothetical protein
MSVTDTPPPSGYSAPQPPAQQPPAQQPPAWAPPPAPAYVPPPRPRRTGLVLFWPTLALIAIALGTLGIVDVSSSVTAAAYPAIAVAITGVMLLVGAFVGRPGGLIALGVASSVALAIAQGTVSATGGNVSGSELDVAPHSAALVADEYSVPNGQITLDLTRVGNVAALDGRTIDVHLNAGEITVIVPSTMTVNVNADIRFAGSIDIDGQTRDGLGPTLQHTVSGSSVADSPTIDLEIDARVGDISVQQD